MNLTKIFYLVSCFQFFIFEQNRFQNWSGYPLLTAEEVAMTATSKDNSCSYCHKTEGHAEACPNGSTATEDTLVQWKEGYERAWEFGNHEWWRLRNYSPSYLLGYEIGRGELYEALEVATQARNREW